MIDKFKSFSWNCTFKETFDQITIYSMQIIFREIFIKYFKQIIKSLLLIFVQIAILYNKINGLIFSFNHYSKIMKK